jgi:hypothetical protein
MLYSDDIYVIMRSFKNWLVSEGKDLFGLDRVYVPKKEVHNDMPIKTISSEIILEDLMTRSLGEMQAFSTFHDHIQWGRHPGSVQMVISPMGSFKSIIRRLQEDLRGDAVWICKRVLPYKEILNATRAIDEDMAEDIFERIKECWAGDLEAPSNDYKDLEKLTIKVAERCRSQVVKPELMIFRGVREIKKDIHYNIYFECAGHGVEAPGSMRLEQFSIDMSYDKESGMIRSFGYGIQSPTRQHLWQVQPSEWDEMFSPSQDQKEIIDAVSAAFSTY